MNQPQSTHLLSDEVARDVWLRLHEHAQAAIMSNSLSDPLSESERSLYNTLTAFLTIRACQFGKIEPDDRGEDQIP